MLKDGTVERVAGEICRALDGCFGPDVDRRFLMEKIQLAVWLCMMDSPHCEQLDHDPRVRLASRIRLDVETILTAHNVGPDGKARVARDVENAVMSGLKGKEQCFARRQP